MSETFSAEEVADFLTAITTPKPFSLPEWWSAWADERSFAAWHADHPQRQPEPLPPPAVDLGSLWEAPPCPNVEWPSFPSIQTANQERVS